MRPEKIISGGQTGADQAGLYAAKELGIPTGGTAPPGYMTDEGPNLKLLTEFGLLVGPPDYKIYPIRTRKNVRDSDGTVWFGEVNSPGGKLTLSTARDLGKPTLVNPTSQQLSHWVEQYHIKVLNVAGNRERKNPGITDRVIEILVDAFYE